MQRFAPMFLPTILAISGSLRPTGSSTLILKAAAASLAGKATVTFYDSIGNLPHFDDKAEPPAAVQQFRDQITQADGIIICQPEYAFGVAGSLKNAIDWTVSSGCFYDKPTALITAATGGDKAHAAMLLTLGVLTATMTEETKLLIGYVKAKLNEDGTVKGAATAAALAKVANALLELIQKQPAP